ncbi:NAD(P)H-binding protein [bacterium]|nr:NAD(P)H-binding protein [candidate division CSSED10-310 bacterium]
MTDKIFVTGATGRVGSELIRILAAKGTDLRAAARHPVAAAEKLPGIRDVVECDFNRPDTFKPALDGIDCLFLTVPPGDNRADRTTSPIVDMALKSGVRLIVDLTAMGVEMDDSFCLRISEKNIEATGIPYVHLRPNWFMQNFDSGPMYADIRTTGALHLPAADAQMSFIDCRDVAAVAAAVLTDDRHQGHAYTLTGSEALDHYRVVDILSQVSGNSIRYVPLSEEAACAGLARAGVAQELIDRWTLFFRIVRAGECARVTRDVERILGRLPVSFEQYAADCSDAWK